MAGQQRQLAEDQSQAAAAGGSEIEKLPGFRKIRDVLKDKIEHFLAGKTSA